MRSDKKKKNKTKRIKIFILCGKWTRTQKLNSETDTGLNECFIGPKIAIIYIQHLNYYYYYHRNETKRREEKNSDVSKQWKIATHKSEGHK